MSDENGSRRKYFRRTSTTLVEKQTISSTNVDRWWNSFGTIETRGDSCYDQARSSQNGSSEAWVGTCTRILLKHQNVEESWVDSSIENGGDQQVARKMSCWQSGRIQGGNSKLQHVHVRCDVGVHTCLGRRTCFSGTTTGRDLVTWRLCVEVDQSDLWTSQGWKIVARTLWFHPQKWGSTTARFQWKHLQSVRHSTTCARQMEWLSFTWMVDTGVERRRSLQNCCHISEKIEMKNVQRNQVWQLWVLENCANAWREEIDEHPEQETFQSALKVGNERLQGKCISKIGQGVHRWWQRGNEWRTGVKVKILSAYSVVSQHRKNGHPQHNTIVVNEVETIFEVRQKHRRHVNSVWDAWQQGQKRTNGQTIGSLHRLWMGEWSSDTAKQEWCSDHGRKNEIACS